MKCVILWIIVLSFGLATTDDDSKSSQSSEEATQGSSCSDGKSYFDGCNQCQCIGGNIACTLKFCPSLDGSIPTTIAPPEDFWLKPEEQIGGGNKPDTPNM